ncbi:hypothetical protein HDU93_005823, partial [Gonapodya sp. JEL0774]
MGDDVDSANDGPEDAIMDDNVDKANDDRSDDANMGDADVDKANDDKSDDANMGDADVDSANDGLDDASMDDDADGNDVDWDIGCEVISNTYPSNFPGLLKLENQNLWGNLCFFLCVAIHRTPSLLRTVTATGLATDYATLKKNALELRSEFAQHLEKVYSDRDSARRLIDPESQGIRLKLDIRRAENFFATPITIWERLQCGRVYRLRDGDSINAACFLRGGSTVQPHLHIAISREVRCSGKSKAHCMYVKDAGAMLSRSVYLPDERLDRHNKRGKNIVQVVRPYRRLECQPQSASEWVYLNPNRPHDITKAIESTTKSENRNDLVILTHGCSVSQWRSMQTVISKNDKRLASCAVKAY